MIDKKATFKQNLVTIVQKVASRIKETGILLGTTIKDIVEDLKYIETHYPYELDSTFDKVELKEIEDYINNQGFEKKVEYSSLCGIRECVRDWYDVLIWEFCV